ncbi:MAG: DUF882 domain-containing protein [Reyranellales bacterium]
MRSFVVSLAVTLAFAGASFAQTTSTGSSQTEIIRGASTAPAVKKAAPAKPAAVHKAAAVQVARPAQSVRHPTTPQTLRGSRYGGFAPSAPLPPPQLDLTSPRSLSLVNANTGETLSVTYWSDGAYRREALDQLNHFCRDSQNNQQTEMDPLLFDVLWHTMQATGYSGTVEVLSAYRSPTTNAWLASVSRGVARDSQHMNGNAMDIRFPGVPVFKIRQAARSLGMGGVGFYPRSGFVHLDTGPIRYW